MRGLTYLAAIFGAAVLAFPAAAQAPRTEGAHLGIASCSGGNCHGATERPAGSSVPGNEYIIWSKRDKHHNAYKVLLEERSLKMARALGLPDAANQKLCLDCHADNVPPERRGRLFQLSDGVGCEACHGGAEGWLGLHISGAKHKDNIAAGLYPTDQPAARAEKCLSCHFGDKARFANHRLYGAGHPRLAFELDTYTVNQPAHFVVDQSYVDRKGRVTDMQVWAAGQAQSLAQRMDAVLDPKHAPHGVFPEFALYDCQSCHHPYDSVRGARPTMTGLPPGAVKLYDANALMLRLVAARVAPDAARSIASHLAAMHRASLDDWPAVQREATALRDIARGLGPALAQREFSRDDMRTVIDGAVAIGASGEDWQFSHAEQVAMAVEAIATGLASAGYLEGDHADATAGALTAVSKSFADEQNFRPDAFAKALKNLQSALGR